MKHPRFRPANSHEKEFFTVLKKRVHEYVVKNERPEQNVDWNLVLKAIFFLGGYLFLWSLLTFYLESKTIALLTCLVMGVLGTGMALNIGHEASHDTFSKKSTLLSRVLYWVSMNLLGTYSYIWKLGHLATHHKYVNVPDHEVGIEGNGVLRLASHTPLKPFHSCQHIYGPFLYCFYTTMWVLFRDWRVLIQGKDTGVLIPRTAKNFLELLLIKSFYFFYMLYLPMKFSSFSATEVLIGFFSMHAILSLYLASMLFTSHLNDVAKFHEPNANGDLRESYVLHHLESTVDINPGSKLASFMLGGFNTHVIHHLFPNVSSTHYHELTKILRTTCREYGMPYLELSFSESIVSHFSYLKEMGRPEAQALPALRPS